MSGEQHDNDSGHVPGGQNAGRIGGPPPSRRGNARHGTLTTGTDSGSDSAGSSKSTAATHSDKLSTHPTNVSIDEKNQPDQSRFQTRVFEPGALKGALGNNAVTGDLGENQQKPARFQTLAFEADELPREWQDLRVLNRPAPAVADSQGPPPPPPRTGTQVMGAIDAIPTSPNPPRNPTNVAPAVSQDGGTDPKPPGEPSGLPPSPHLPDSENRRVSSLSKPNTQLFKPGELPHGIGFEAEESMSDPLRASNVIYGGKPGGTALFDVPQESDADNSPRYPTASIDRTQMLSPVSTEKSSKISLPVGSEPAWVTHGSKPGSFIPNEAAKPLYPHGTQQAPTDDAARPLRVAKRSLHSETYDEGRLEPVFVTSPEENDPTSMVLAPPPDDPAFHRAATVVREPSISNHQAPKAFSERETMLNIPAVRLPTDGKEPITPSPDAPGLQKISTAPQPGPAAGAPNHRTAGATRKPDGANEPAWVNDNVNPVVERERQRHATGQSMFAPQSKTKSETKSETTTSASLTPDLRFYGVISLLILTGSMAVPTMAGEQLIAPWAGIFELVGPAFTAALFGLLTLAWVAIPMPPAIRAGLLAVTGIGCLVLASMNIHDSVLRLVFHGHPAIGAIFSQSMVVTALFWCSVVLYPAGLFARKFAPQGMVPLAVTLVGLVILAFLLLGLGVLTDSESPLFVMQKVLQSEFSTRGDRLASILIFSAAGIAVLGLISFVSQRLAAFSTIWGGLFITTFLAALFATATHVSQHIGGALEPVKLILVTAGGSILSVAGLGGLIASLSTRRV